MAILIRKNTTSEIAEHHYIKQQLFPNEFDSSIWGEGSLYMKGNTLVFDFDKMDGKYEHYKVYKATFEEALKELGIKEILFKGSKITRMEFEGLGCSFYKVKLINMSTSLVAFFSVYDASEVEGDIFLKQKDDYYFTKNDFKNTGVFQVRTKGYLRLVDANLEASDWKKTSGMEAKDVLEYINKKFVIPQGVYFYLGGIDTHFVKGIKDKKELNKFIFYKIKPEQFIQHPNIPDLYYYV
mgnify:FL=1